MMSQARLKQARGFTLIELIVAMGMVAILSVSLYASLRIAFRAKEIAEKTLEPARTAELAMEFIRNDLQNAMTPNNVIIPPAQATVPPFAGSFEGTHGTDGRDDLIFYSTADGPLHATGNGDLQIESSDIKKIELMVQPFGNNNDYVLIRRVTPNLLSSGQPVPDDEMLCRGVSGFTLQYYNGIDWLDTWDSTDTTSTNSTTPTIPLAVRVTLQINRPTSSGQMKSFNYTRVFQLGCSILPPPV